MTSFGIEDEEGDVFAADLDWLAGGGALVERVADWLRIVVADSFADGLRWRFDGLEGLIRPHRPSGCPFGLPGGSLSRCARLGCVQNASDPSAVFDAAACWSMRSWAASWPGKLASRRLYTWVRQSYQSMSK